MRRPLTICLAITAALALPASAGAASKFYGGSIDGGGKIGVDVTSNAGDPFQVDAMKFRRLPESCSGGPALISVTWAFNNLLVVNNRFKVDGADGLGHHLFFTGTFKQGGKKLTGRVKDGPSDYGGNFDNCTSAKRSYSAKRGASGPHPKLHRAFRVR